MKVFDILPPASLNEGKKKRGKRVKIPTWFKNTSFRKGPYGAGGMWGGWHAWGNDSGGGDGGGG
ncbi:hypothetical protein E4H12_01790, partial [Candidatus Thorarchaeota archaeon]